MREMRLEARGVCGDREEGWRLNGGKNRRGGGCGWERTKGGVTNAVGRRGLCGRLWLGGGKREADSCLTT